MPRNTPIIIILRTACGCEKKMAYPSEPRELRVAIQRPYYALLETSHRADPSHYIRTFEHGRVIATGEGAMERVVEYNEVLPREHSQDRRNAPVPRIDVHQFTDEGDWRVLNVNRVLRDIDHVIVEVI